MTIDEPVSFGGSGQAPNPAEVMLAALGASLEVTIRCYAEYLNITVDSVGVDLSAELDTQGFFGINAHVRAGFPLITAKVNIVSSEEIEVISDLLEIASSLCPVLDNVKNPTNVYIELDIRKPGDATS
ncbi:OsmC family protein (plasmid) [Mesorhizobium sp. AR07]|uniref:OsmC family protein n=1 Tax=Mesorhizobium sp. AR07 TaxID=2865838 RepID=UPI00215DEA48|nr:OsmC family protein [Mesorhizobium sp. AR07]UVK49008.1 OsmC family protein [Mesorhizobium sp. AR07]